MNALALLSIPLLPLLVPPAILAFGRRLRYGGGEWLVAAIALSLLALAGLAGRPVSVSTTWVIIAGRTLTVGLALTPLATIVCALVATIALWVTIYSLGYAPIRDQRPRFFAYLALFVGAMLALVLADSLLLLFAAWEAIGLASYLLIAFHYREAAARRAARKAFLMTRLGDMGLLLAWLLLLNRLATTDIAAVLAATPALPPPFLTEVALLLFVAAIGKSAQLPLTAWLPDAMAGPAPVSALIHSATLVAAGVYVIARLFPLFLAAPGVLTVVFGVGAVTAVFASLVAIVQMDLKRLLAWSTVAQLGEMMMALGLAGVAAAVAHLVAHAAYKSTLFVTAGSLDVQAGTRDLRRLGGLWRALPVSAAAFVVAALALAGIPPLSGFWSEDLLLGSALRAGPGAAALFVLLALLAGLYIGRASAAVWFGHARDAHAVARPESAITRVATAALAALAAMIGLVGFLLREHIVGSPPMATTSWRIAVLVAAVTGLVGGTLAGLRVDVRAPGFAFAQRLEAMLVGATAAVAGTTLSLAGVVDRIEARLDALARIVSRTATALADTAASLEHGIAYGGDRASRDIAGLGERLRRVQSGELYLYTLGLFVWSLAVIVAGLLWAR